MHQRISEIGSLWASLIWSCVTNLWAVCHKRDLLVVATDDQENISPTPIFMAKLFLVGRIFGKTAQFLLESRADHSLIYSNIIPQFKLWNLPAPARSDWLWPDFFWVSQSLTKQLFSLVSLQVLRCQPTWQWLTTFNMMFSLAEISEIFANSFTRPKWHIP